MVLPILRITTFLDPTFAEAFDFAGWHVAYNLRAEEKDERQRVQWVKLGIQVYEQGLERSPNDFSLLFGLGWTAYDKLGDTVLAAYYLERALNAPGKFTKDIDWVRHMLAHAYERMPNMRLALKHWEEAALDAPYNPVARGATITIEERYTAAEAMSQNGYYEEAIQILENIIRHPDKKFATIPRHMLAQIYKEMGDLESAYAIMKQMTEWHKLEPRAEFKAEQLEQMLRRRRLQLRE
jgi:tetratricopeptide (TPR) repeat protein